MANIFRKWNSQNMSWKKIWPALWCPQNSNYSSINLVRAFFKKKINKKFQPPLTLREFFQKKFKILLHIFPIKLHFFPVRGKIIDHVGDTFDRPFSKLNGVVESAIQSEDGHGDRYPKPFDQLLQNRFGRFGSVFVGPNREADDRIPTSQCRIDYGIFPADVIELSNWFQDVVGIDLQGYAALAKWGFVIPWQRRDSSGL